MLPSARHMPNFDLPLLTTVISSAPSQKSSPGNAHFLHLLGMPRNQVPGPRNIPLMILCGSIAPRINLLGTQPITIYALPNRRLGNADQRAPYVIRVPKIAF